MAEITQIMRLRIKIDKVSELTSSRLFSMTEAALDTVKG
jgi:hypothetical protein